MYGDADDDEHIKLARVLQTLLSFSPEDVASVNAKIEYYENSWWHRTADMLKLDPAAQPGAEAAPPSSSWVPALPSSFWGMLGYSSDSAPPGGAHGRHPPVACQLHSVSYKTCGQVASGRLHAGPFDGAVHGRQAPPPPAGSA